MKKLIAVVVLGLLCSAFAAADVSHASLVPVRKTHHRVTRHRAHKAVKHHAAKRQRHTV
ncbi:MAG TPA: hypothetical protein VHW45_01165 [Candidatus Sulfotelmatobacter sp.]|nr:hypothetical protein [Candidatus Sulfotelmatobacter sp.]